MTLTCKAGFALADGQYKYKYFSRCWYCVELLLRSNPHYILTSLLGFCRGRLFISLFNDASVTAIDLLSFFDTVASRLNGKIFLLIHPAPFPRTNILFECFQIRRCVCLQC